MPISPDGEYISEFTCSLPSPPAVIRCFISPFRVSKAIKISSSPKETRVVSAKRRVSLNEPRAKGFARSMSLS